MAANKSKEFQSFFLRDIPKEDHKAMLASAQARRIPAKLWLREAIQEKLRRERNNVEPV